MPRSPNAWIYVSFLISAVGWTVLLVWIARKVGLAAVIGGML